MKHDIQHWHMADSSATMIMQAINILQDPTTNYQRIIPFDIKDTAEKMMQLFD
jgi:hypothetical protein